ncbi:MAG: dihydrodipicolinate synthase family protein [Candidatus Omnitrophota bacterium]
MSFIHPITKKEFPDCVVGPIAPMFTPVDAERRIDHDALRKFTRWLAAEPSITSLFWRSGCGRMYTFSAEEFKQSLDTVVEAAEGKKFVFAGSSGIYDGDFSRKTDPVRYLDETIALSAYAKEHGATAVVLIVPAGLPVAKDSTPEETVAAFFEKVHENTNVPILIYNPQAIPKEFSITPSLVRRLAPLKRIIGAKVSTNDLYWLGSLVEAAEGKEFYLIAGSECVYYQALVTGVCGVIGQGCCVYPQILRRILDAVGEGDFAAARQAQFDVNLALDGFQGIVPDQSGFAYMRKKGLKISAYCRDGASPLSGAKEEEIFQAIEPFIRKYAS